jgi:malic enzyme
MGIPIGKLSLYTALAGIPPECCLPILLDVRTDNAERLKDPLYIGWRNRRVRGPEYDEFVDTFVSAVKRRWPHVLLQWEDFAGVNAARFLERYRNQLCTFNDDIQGTAAVATGTLLSAINVTGISLKEQRVCSTAKLVGLLSLMMVNLVVVGMILANVFSLVGCIIFFKIVLGRLGKSSANFSLILLRGFPRLIIFPVCVF